MARKKSLVDLAGQAGALQGRIDMLRAENIGRGGQYGDSEDNRLHERGLRILRAYNRYAENIHNKQGTTVNDGADGRQIPTKAQYNRKYSQSTYIGTVNG